MWCWRSALLAVCALTLEAAADSRAFGGGSCAWPTGGNGSCSPEGVARRALIQREVSQVVRSPAIADAALGRSHSDPHHGDGDGAAAEPTGDGGGDAEPTGNGDGEKDIAAEARAVLDAALSPGGDVEPLRFDWSGKVGSSSTVIVPNATSAAASEAEEVLRAAMARAAIPGALNSTRIASAASGPAPIRPNWVETIGEAGHHDLNMTQEEWELRCMFATHETPDCVGILGPFVTHPHFKKRHDAMVFLMAGLVLISLIFHITYDQIIDWLQDNVGHYSVKLAYALFKEIMLLGVIALLLSVTIRSGWAANWSRALFYDVTAGAGHGEGFNLDPLGEHHSLGDIREGHCVSELTIIFEDIHMLIFFSCTSLVGITAINMFHVRKAVALFREAEEAVTYNRGSIGITMADLLDRYDAAQGNYFLQLKYWHQMCYLTLSSAFTTPATGRPARGVRSETFSFLDYTETCCGQAVVDQVQTPVWCYLTIAALTFICRPLLTLRGMPAIVTILGVAALLASVSAVILVKLVWIERQMVPLPHDIRNKCCESDRFEDAFSIDRVDMKALEGIKPYKRLAVVNYGASRWRRLLFGTQRPSQREQLFWFQKNGPIFLRVCLRLISALVSMLIGAASYHMWCYPYTWFRCFWAFGLIIMLLACNFYFFQHSLTKLVMLTSSEVEPHLDVIDAVNAANRRLAQDRHLRLLSVLKVLAVQRSVRADKANGFARYLRSYGDVTSEIDRASIEELVGEKPLTYQEFKKSFKSFGEAYRAQAPNLDGYLEAAMQPDEKDQDPDNLWFVRHAEVDKTVFQVIVAAANIAENGYFSNHLQDEAKAALRHFLAALPKKAPELSEQDAVGGNADEKEEDTFNVSTLEALMERLEYKGSYTKAGMPRHAQAITLLRATNDRFGDPQSGHRKWTTNVEGLVRYLALLDKEVNRPENSQDEEESGPTCMSPLALTRAHPSLRSGWLSRSPTMGSFIRSTSSVTYVRSGSNQQVPNPPVATLPSTESRKPVDPRSSTL